MEIKLVQGDYVPDGLGGIQRCKGSDALLQRVLYRLTAHRGQFSLLPQLGSQLYLLGRESSANRASSAKKFVAEALAEEDVDVTDVILSPLGEGRIQVEVLLDYQGSDLSILLTV